MTPPIPRDTLERALRRHVLDAWFPRSIDREHGGFLCDFDRKWRSCGPHDKLLEFQSRQTWLAADALRVYPHDEGLRRSARCGFRCLREAFWDHTQGGFYHRLDRAGRPLQGRTKHIHGLAYAILACVAVSEATGDRDAITLARAAFEWLDAHARDREHGCYFGFLRRDGHVLREAGTSDWPSALDPIGTPLGWKDVNVHSDLLEGLTRLHAAWPDPRVLERVAEVTELLTERLVAADGAIFYFARADGTPAADHVRYGQLLQSGPRLLEAYRQLGEAERGVADARRLLDYCLEHARDRRHGGFFHANTDFPGAPRARSKQWWMQTEGLRALLEVEEACGDPYLEDALLAHWRYLERFLFDERYGGVYQEGLDVIPRWRRHPALGPAWVTNKGSVWKYAGHEGQALLTGLHVHAEGGRARA